jgi:hypothetical protein
MPLIPKVEPKQEKKVVSARLDEEVHGQQTRTQSEYPSA